MMDTFPKMLELAFPDVPVITHKGDQYIELDNGAEIWFGGLDDKERVDKILGKEYATIYANEASQISYATITTLRTRLAQKIDKSNGRPLALRGYYDLNPTGTSHWSHDEFIKGIIPGTSNRLPEGSRTVVHMNPTDNMDNLPESYIEELKYLPETQRKRFFEGVYLSEIPGALWTASSFLYEDEEPDDLTRIVVAVDPSGSSKESAVGQADEIGIVVAAARENGQFVVLEDASILGGPSEWARAAVNASERWQASRIIAEKNFGGEMVRHTIKTADANANVKLVSASRGKAVRAEPIAALYDEKKVSHLGRFVDLETQMTHMSTHGYTGTGSPDRVDALVWALSELSQTRRGRQKRTAA